MPAKGLLCICQICNCGRHRCPHKPQPKVITSSSPPCSITEYSMQFKRYQAKRRQSFRPPAKAVTHETKMEVSTTNRNDFVSHPITPPPPKPVVVYKSPEGTMEGSSEYKETYQGKWAIPAKPMRPPQTKGSTNDTFDHKSTHAVEYVVHTIQPREGFGPKQAYETPKERFEGTSTVQTDYVDFGTVSPPKSLKPQQKSNTSEQRFEGVSSYRSAYAAHTMPAKYQRPKEVYKPSEKTFYGNTTFKSDFQAHFGIKPAASLKPPQPKVATGQAFEDKTTSRMSYTKWELPSKVSRPPTVYVPPSETFAGNSTYKGDFQVYQSSKPKSFKPADKREDLAPFQGISSHDADYKAWSNVQKPGLIRLEKKYSPPSDRFDAKSTFKAHYTGEFGARAASTKPPVQAYTKSCAMEETTSYRDSFTGTGYVPCPASSLVGDVSQAPGTYKYSHEDNVTGHKFFSPTKDEAPKIAVETVA